MNTNTTKPYRRFRVHGGSASGGIEELRRMTDGEVARAGGPPRAAVVTPPRPSQLDSTPPAPPPPGRQQAASSSGDLPPDKPSRRWWSLRGLSWVGWTWRIAVVLVLGLLVWGIAGYIALNSAVSDANSRITASAVKALTPSNGSMLTTPTNILFIGSDARPGQGASRSDTMMLMRLDPNSGKIKYLSIPRDTLIDSQSCPSCGAYVQNQKINAAYFFAGEAG